MILVDFSGSMHAAIAVDLNMNKGIRTDIGYLRHLIFEQLKSYHKKFSNRYGEMIICLDSHTGNWRRDYFSLYKAGRAKARAESGIDWKSIFKDMEQIISDLKEYFPYKVIRVPELEADDVIAILTMKAEDITEKNLFDDMKWPVLIISNDKDFKQLHKYKYVKQYIPRSGNIIKELDPEFYLINQILHGDAVDGIPNIKSDEDTFMVYGKRQTAIRSKFVKQFLEEGISCLTDFEKQRFETNKKMISFEEIPEKYNDLVLSEINKPINKNKFKLMQYFAENKLNQLIEQIEEFY